MNFTREPIIETIVTPMEGYKLIVRSSKGTAQEEFVVDAVEVVSFGHSFFFRSLEKPKAFLVPISDYEILEVKETRVVLKNANVDRAIKIGGGREASLKREPQESQVSEERTESESAPAQEPRSDKKRDRGRRHKRRRHDGREMREEQHRPKGEEEPKQEESARESNIEAAPETTVPPQTFSRLFPPPPTLISEKLAKIKKENPEFFEKEALEPKEQMREENPTIDVEDSVPDKKEEGTSGSEPRDMSRLSSEATPSIQRTSFLSLDSWFKR